MGGEERRQGMVELLDEIKSLRKEIIDNTKLTSEIGRTVAVVEDRQTKNTIPTLEKIGKVLYGNGEKGLLQDHAVCQDRLRNVEKGIGDAKAWLLTLASGIALGGLGVLVRHLIKAG